MNINRVESSFILSKNACCSQAEGGMVASAFPAATDAGAEILRSGGNAVDAAIATAFALCVCEPQACSLGGQSSILLHMNGCSFALEGSGRIPELLNKKIMQKEDVVHGYRATTVPTTPAVLNYAHKRFGKLSWDTVLKPAVRLAQHGYIITELQHTLLKREETLFNAVRVAVESIIISKMAKHLLLTEIYLFSLNLQQFWKKSQSKESNVSIKVRLRTSLTRTCATTMAFYVKRISIISLGQKKNPSLEQHF